MCGKHSSWHHTIEMRAMSAEERFWLYVQPPSLHDCWEWWGTRQVRYGTIRANGSGNVLAHRLSYEMHKGPIPDGLVIDHLCSNVFCVNPLHLEAVTQKVNMSRGAPARKTECKRGHDLTDPDNLYPGSLANGRRNCRTCRKERDAEQRQRVLAESGTG